MRNDRVVKIYLSELADRALRFHMHLEAIEKEFYQPAPGLGGDTIPRDKPIFLNSFRQCVWNILDTVIRLSSPKLFPVDDAKRDEIMAVARHGFVSINHLHESGLVHLPRPTEPVELRRFCRIISRHVLRQDEADVAVYVTETIPEGAYAGDPVSEIKQEDFARLNELTREITNAPALLLPDVKEAEAIHVTISRVDARNPVRWPTLLHEAGHRLLPDAMPKNKRLDQQFDEWLLDETRDRLSALSVDIYSWLTEVWCDLFAALVMGPSFYFSQFSAFAASPQIDIKLDSKHPPHSFRLRLIAMFLRHRYPSLVRSEKLLSNMRECAEVAEYWDRSGPVNLKNNDVLKVCFDSMRFFFQEHFFSGSGTEPENFDLNFQGMVRYVKEISPEGLESMATELARGLPIPSKVVSDAVPFAEEPTSVQEVLLAAWLHRLGELRDKTLSALSTPTHLEWRVFLATLVLPPIERFDDAVLRSLQISEWLHLLTPRSPARIKKRSKPSDTRVLHPILLNDAEILELLTNGELRIRPLVDLEQQLGSTSLDIRLGTSFEVYLPACRRTS